MGDLATIVGGGSVLGLLTIAFGFLLNSARADRKELTEERAARELVEQELDKQRRLRREAEDREAKLAREVARLAEKVDDLSAEIARLRVQLGSPI